MAYILEETKGHLPVWLAPTQAIVLPVSEKTFEYAGKIYEKLLSKGIRVKFDDRSEKIGYKIREAQAELRVPFMLVIGQKEQEENIITVRNRDTGESTSMSYEEFEKLILEKIANKSGEV